MTHTVQDQHADSGPDGDVGQPLFGLDLLSKAQCYPEHQYGFHVAQQSEETEREESAGADIGHEGGGADHGQQYHQEVQTRVLRKVACTRVLSHNDPGGEWQRKQHVEPEPAQVIRFQLAAQDKVDREAHGDQQCFP